jgi:hypothetical protein
MRKYFPIYDEAVSHIGLCNCSTLNFLIYEENFIFFFNAVGVPGDAGSCPGKSRGGMPKYDPTTKLIILCTMQVP